jgi:hypothetical protein
LGVLASLFRVIDMSEIVSLVRATPTSSFVRRIWFLYEWLRGERIDVRDAQKVRAVYVVDPKLQVVSAVGTVSTRHRVIDNLPGSRRFCPMVRRTAKIQDLLEAQLSTRARGVVGRTRPDVLARAAAFLLLADSKSSFEIEGERPSSDRTTRWGQAIAQAGSQKLSITEFERLQRIVIGDSRFVKLGIRNDGGFIGTHDRVTQAPLPDHISAKPEDLRDLLEGVITYDQEAALRRIDAVILAAVIAFGFVFIHPFTDGNGRIHRWLIHHVLSVAEYSPPGIVFPVSSVILRRVAEYRATLHSYSAQLLPYVQWKETSSHNIEVLNDTADYYRYFDATSCAEFLYECVQQTIDVDLPREVRFLEAYDRFSREIQDVVDMPESTVELLHGFLEQGAGRLSNRARTREFAALTLEETTRVEALYAACFVRDEQEPRKSLLGPPV